MSGYGVGECAPGGVWAQAGPASRGIVSTPRTDRRRHADIAVYDDWTARGTARWRRRQCVVCRCHREDIRWPNGLGFAPDGQALYVCEYAESRILLIDKGDRHVFANAPSGECDGLAVDTEGGVWVALGTGSAVARFTPDGKLDTTINLPDGFVSAVAFNGTTLLITTAGRLLSHPVGITGTPLPATSIPLPLTSPHRQRFPVTSVDADVSATNRPPAFPGHARTRSK
ncbi:SMP-30/gluconolactonase/LRE family protein [Nocardia sp. NPDC051321]|uniref:SMP-30/gluconolactonase/LRE family protein n=1 Tax=Nocardia sp. NPDC051321 TaxID=3364323 RepID=UPI0037B8B51D